MSEDNRLGYRVSIFYPYQAGEPFNWSHYLPNHLPLAVGTSMRHARISACDVDKPLEYARAQGQVCICVVYFREVEAMQRFREFFATGHPESETIIADQPNYTNILPVFVAGEYLRQYDSGDSGADSQYRLRLLIPAGDGGKRLDFNALETLGKETLDTVLLPACRVLRAEIDHMLGGLGPEDAPAFDAVWTLIFDDREELEKARKLISDAQTQGGLLSRLVDTTPQLLSAEIIPFEMALAEKVRDAR